jgi:hypothetical protein
VGFQPWGNSPPLRSYYPIVLQSSCARFATVREGLRLRSERAESVGQGIAGKQCKGEPDVAFSKSFPEILYGESSVTPCMTLHGYIVSIELETDLKSAPKTPGKSSACASSTVTTAPRTVPYSSSIY